MDLIEKAGRTLHTILEKCKKDKKPVLLLLSGGSGLGMLDYVDDSSLGGHITVTMLDERFSDSSSVNNFKQMMETSFYKRAQSKGARFLKTIPVESDTLDSFAQTYEKNIRDWKEDNPDGCVIATQGIGKDAHTAGIMPMPDDKATFEKMFMGDSWITGYDTKGKLPHFPIRVTSTMTFLKNEVDVSIIYSYGKERWPVLSRILGEDDESDVHVLPGKIVHAMKKVFIFTDFDEETK